jgi:hypothetical protein
MRVTLSYLRYKISVTILVPTFTIDLVFENCFLSAMAPYVFSRDGRSLSIYGSECQPGGFLSSFRWKWLEKLTGVKDKYI